MHRGVQGREVTPLVEGDILYSVKGHRWKIESTHFAIRTSSAVVVFIHTALFFCLTHSGH